MSNKTSNPANEAVATLSSVDIGMKRQQKQLLVLAALCVIAVPSALLALVMIITSADSEPAQDFLDPAQVRAMQTRLDDMTTQQATLLASNLQLQDELAALSRKVGTLDINDERNATVRVQQLLIRQEQEFQQFLATLEGGMYNFHMMIPHSRGWWDAYKTDLLVSVDQSKARELLAGAVREIEPEGITQ